MVDLYGSSITNIDPEKLLLCNTLLKSIQSCHSLLQYNNIFLWLPVLLTLSCQYNCLVELYTVCAPSSDGAVLETNNGCINA